MKHGDQILPRMFVFAVDLGAERGIFGYASHKEKSPAARACNRAKQQVLASSTD
jgi:hypothetical protein